MTAMLEDLEKRIGYVFKDKKILHLALTHSSYAYETKTDENNERLEFLGDSVLGLIVSDYIFSNEKTLPEGDLTKLRSSLVCERALAKYAVSIDLGSYLFLGKSEIKTEGQKRPSILADAFEALIAAIYKDGGYKPAKKFVLEAVSEDIAGGGRCGSGDYKTMLQEITQQNKEEKLSYKTVEEKGPDHDKTFVVELLLNSNVIATGNGRSKKNAEQDAAKKALELMGIEVR